MDILKELLLSLVFIIIGMWIIYYLVKKERL